MEKVRKARAMVDEIVKEDRLVYGITTGFGKFARTRINKENLEELQDNLIRSHAAGVGPALSPEKTRMLLALRINVLAKGYSGISPENLGKLVEAFNGTKSAHSTLT
jgi:histidine ammonia-lyase